ncbi:MAG: hypothetical protein ACRCS7_02545, partial [Tannerellaceae bacterium]
MKILSAKAGEYFDLSTDSVFDFDYYNPIFSEDGSQSMPIDLPATKKNKRLLGYPDQICLLNKPALKEKVIVEDKGVQRQGTMVLLDASGSVSIGFDSGDAYTSMQRLKLNEFKGLPDYSPGYYDPITGVYESGINAYCNKMRRYYDGTESHTDFAVFPLLLKREVNADKVYYTILNDVERGDLSVIRPLKGLNQYTEQAIVDSNVLNMTYPKGYSLAPFFRLHTVLRLALKSIGYEVNQNVFETDSSLSKLCVLHNVMDAGCKLQELDKINYSTWMPDCSIADLLDAIRARFGAYVFFDSNTMTASVRLIRDIIRSPAACDLTAYIDTIDISFDAPKRLVLTASGSMDLNDVEKDTMFDFASKYNNMCNRQEEQFCFNPGRILNLRYRKATGEYYKFRKVVAADVSTLMYRVSSNSFGYNTGEVDFEAVSLTATDELCATFKEDDNLLKTMVSPVQNYKMENDIMMPFYSVDPKHIATSFRGSGDAEKEDTTTPLSFAYYAGRAKNYAGVPIGLYYATTRAWDNQGQNKIVDSGLHFDGDDGLFQAYWKEYDAMLRHANFLVDCRMSIPYSIYLNLKMYNIVLIHGQRCLIEKISTEGDMYNVKLRAVDPRQPNNLETEQSPAKMEYQKYYWRFVNYYDADVAAYADALKTELGATRYTIEDVFEKVEPQEHMFAYINFP